MQLRILISFALTTFLFFFFLIFSLTDSTLTFTGYTIQYSTVYYTIQDYVFFVWCQPNLSLQISNLQNVQDAHRTVQRKIRFFFFFINSFLDSFVDSFVDSFFGSFVDSLGIGCWAFEHWALSIGRRALELLVTIFIIGFGIYLST